jgi:hypothetical protein
MQCFIVSFAFKLLFQNYYSNLNQTYSNNIYDVTSISYLDSIKYVLQSKQTFLFTLKEHANHRIRETKFCDFQFC